MQGLQIDTDAYTQADFFTSEDPDLFTKANEFGVFLDAWKSTGTYAYHRRLRSSCRNNATIHDSNTGQDHQVIVMASNNYLALNTRPEVMGAARDAVVKYGTSMCGSRFLSGTYDLVVDLERQLADFEYCQDAMVFTTGYQANIGTISALLRPGDVVFIDRLCHASIVDGCRLAHCAVRAFKHSDVDNLAEMLAKCAHKYRGKLIIVDGVFSMDGDIAPLPDIVELARRYGARVMVDEAHGTGVVGPNGGGTVEHFGLTKEVDIVLGTFSKALASTGGFIASTRQVIDYVRHYARSYIFTASPTPPTVASALAALDILKREPQLRRRLWENIRYFHRGLKDAGFEVFPDPPASAIMTVVVGPDTVVRALGKGLHEAGLFVGTAAYPAVPKNEGRLRFSLSAGHTVEDLDRALQILSTVAGEHQLV